VFRVLFVCLGNICRSPTAEGVFRGMVEAQGLSALIKVDSVGTGAWHIGKAPDARAVKAARRRGYDLSGLRARQVAAPDDFDYFDLILAMDKDNLLNLQRICPLHQTSKLKLFMTFGSDSNIQEVPDPYYGGELGFDEVLDLIEDASAGLLRYIQSINRR
jgi:protein-tyrosine phosphatase